MPIEVPWRQTFKLKRKLRGVECWNFTSGEVFDVPAGKLVRLENVNDATSITVCVVDRKGNAPGIPLRWMPPGKTELVQQLGYRFIVPNRDLSRAIGIPLPKRQYDLVGEIMRYEDGSATAKQTKRLFGHLRKTGIGRGLQGHYSSRM